MELNCEELKVSLALLNREERHGWLVHFDPKTQRLALHDGSSEIRYFDTPKIAYIVFHTPIMPTIPPKSQCMEEIIVHTVRGDRFHVLTAKNKPSTHGIFAFDAKETATNCYYFYRRGIRSLEQPKPIGQLLVDDAAISNSEVEKALGTQQALRKKKLGDILVEMQTTSHGDIEEIVETHRKRPQKIGDVLIESGLIKDEDLQKALKEQSKNRSLKVGQVLINMGLITEVELVSSLARKFNLPFVDLEDYTINSELIEHFDINLLLRFQVLPVSSSPEGLTIASSDPMNFDAFDAIRFQTTHHINEILATSTQIMKMLEEYMAIKLTDTDDWLTIEHIPDDKDDGLENEILEVKAAEAQPIVRLVNKILINAVQQGASDIHILPQSKNLHVLYRINGDLEKIIELEKWVQRRMISRIKLLSGMNITNHKKIQDGRMVISYENKKAEFRISCIPNAYGESIVMRILNKDMEASLETLGMSEKDRCSLAKIIRKPFGLVLATGPTGSGKSTTLFALMQDIIDLPLHIITIEDPVESEIEKANQIQINVKAGLTFASSLRNVLRHDPDVIMIGEMRDKETASIGIEAALTGHLMLSTLHTNSAIDTVVRLHDMGIPNYLLAPALCGVISQSLVKCLCEHCRQLLDDDHDEVDEILEAMGMKRLVMLYKPGECGQCANTGFSGRVMAYEFLEITEVVRHAIHDGKVGKELEEIAQSEGMVSKAQHALSLAEKGLICRDDLLKLLV